VSTRSSESDAQELRCERVRAEDGPELVALFERAGSGCYCRYWHFAGDKNAWLGRLAGEPERNAAELRETLEQPELHGLVARTPTALVGWMKLTRAEAVPKLYDQRVYRNLPCFGGDRSEIFTVGCFLVDPEHRRHGVARELLRAGLELARQSGARAVEAFPRRAELLGDEERWLGPFDSYLAEGFRIVHDLTQYPVLRRTF